MMLASSYRDYSASLEFSNHDELTDMDFYRFSGILPIIMEH